MHIRQSHLGVSLRCPSTLRATLLAVTATFALSACSAAGDEVPTPGLADRGTVMTTVKLSRQDLTTSVSLSGKVTMNPVFGLESPADGQVRYFDVKPQTSTPSTPTTVANVWAGGVPHAVTVPAGATPAGRLVDDKATVLAGMPIVSAKLAGYGIVADIDGAHAYQLARSPASIRAQLKNGPGPFKCRVLGTIAALPAGTIPAEPEPEPPPEAENADSGGVPAGKPMPPEYPPGSIPGEAEQGSEPTGMRLVCTPTTEVKLINGASATIRVITKKVTNALVAPVEAVAGTTGNGEVEVIAADGSRKTRSVKLGLTDGRVVEIRSGLTGDETLAVPGPNLPAVEEENPGPEMRYGG